MLRLFIIHHHHHHFPPLLFLYFLLFSLIFTFSPSTGKKLVFVSGDILLGALFPIHKSLREPPLSFQCGALQIEDGIQPLEALLFSLDEINKNSLLLPGISLGVIALDSCDDPIYASEESLLLLKGFMGRKSNVSFTSSSSPSPLYDIVGLIGPQTSGVSVQLATLGRLFEFPQISYLSTSNTLCNEAEFPYFFRTVPDDVHQARAILEVLNTFDWNYASIVISDSSYGEMGYEALKEQMTFRNICLPAPILIIDKYFSSLDYRNVIYELRTNTLSPIVIVFCDRSPAGKLLEAAKEVGAESQFIWIGSDAWASKESVVRGREKTVLGAIAVQLLRRPLPGFRDYFSSLTPETNSRNPWFDEYIKITHHCSYDSVNNTDSHGDNSNNINHNNNNKYNFKSKKKKNNNSYNCSHQVTNTSFETHLYVHFVRDAVYAFATALHNLQRDSCGSSTSLCPLFRRAMFTSLRDYLVNVSFLDVDGHEFKFYGNHESRVSSVSSSSNSFRHDGPPRYSIINLIERNSKFEWTDVGTYINGQLFKKNKEFVEHFSAFTTNCPRIPCGPDEVKVLSGKDSCCWLCKPCRDFEYKKSEFECADCPPGHGTQRNSNRSLCRLIPEVYMRWTSLWALSSLVLATLGILLTLLTSGVFCLYWNTPIVKASGRECSLLLLAGTFLSFTTTFVIVVKPSNVSCALLRFGIGFCYTVCYAALVSKTNRVFRIFENINSASGQVPCTSPSSCLILSLSLILVEVLLNGTMLINLPPSTRIIVTSESRILICSGIDDSFMIGLAYPFILLVLGTYFAFKTRKAPDAFNESSLIFFANSITLIHWCAVVPLYLSSLDPLFRSIILSFSLSLSGIAQLICLLFPKLYIVICKPEKNTRVAIMTTIKSSRSLGLMDDGLRDGNSSLKSMSHYQKTSLHSIPRPRSTSISRSTQTNCRIQEKDDDSSSFQMTVVERHVCSRLFRPENTFSSTMV